MVKILAGEKGEGKTKRMIDMANAAGKEARQQPHVRFAL